MRLSIGRRGDVRRFSVVALGYEKSEEAYVKFLIDDALDCECEVEFERGKASYGECSLL